MKRTDSKFKIALIVIVSVLVVTLLAGGIVFLVRSMDNEDDNPVKEPEYTYVVDDKLGTMYFNTAITPDFDNLNWDDGTYYSNNQLYVLPLIETSDENFGLYLFKMVFDEDSSQVVYYVSPMSYTRFKGSSDGISSLAYFYTNSDSIKPSNIGISSFGWQKNAVKFSKDVTISKVNAQQDVWGKWVSNEPFDAIEYTETVISNGTD